MSIGKWLTPKSLSVRGGSAITAPRLSSVGWADLDQTDPGRFRSFSPLGNIHDHAIPFAETREPTSFKSGDVDEYLLCAVIPSDEAIFSALNHFTVPVTSTAVLTPISL
jgi:hypothetical protein